MSEIDYVGGVGYLEQYLIPRIRDGFDCELKYQSHCCGFCRNWKKHNTRDDYGDCEVHGSFKGFDCPDGHVCKDFSQAKMFHCSFDIAVISNE